MATRVPRSVADVSRVAELVYRHPANADRRLRQLARTFWFRGRAFAGKSTVVPIGDHSRLTADLRFASSILAAYANPYDYYEWMIWRQHLRPGDLFVDVGANVGIYTLLAADAGCRVIAFEPDPSSLRQLRDNVQLNGYADRVTIVPKAVGARIGHTEFLTNQDALGRLGSGSEAGSRVPVTTLDSEIHEPVAGLKVDVEGAEHLVLQGASSLLKRRAFAMIQLEWNFTARQNFARDRAQDAGLLEELGYRLFRPDRQGGLTPCGSDEGSDVFALP